MTPNLLYNCEFLVLGLRKVSILMHWPYSIGVEPDLSLRSILIVGLDNICEKKRRSGGNKNLKIFFRFYSNIFEYEQDFPAMPRSESISIGIFSITFIIVN